MKYLSPFVIAVIFQSSSTNVVDSFVVQPLPTKTGQSIISSPLFMSTTETMTTNPRKEGLALQLDDGTRKSHSIAESSAFVTGFFKGLGTRESYTKLLTSLYFVYEAMEDAFDKTSEATVKKLDDYELRRFDALNLDMEYFCGEGWKNKVKPSPATRKYVDRIKEVAANNPKLLIAHQYSRYLGDLFGGQMMSGMATKSLNLNEGKGVAFYTFENIQSTSSDFITEWYRKLNELDLTEKEKEDIVDEANYVFQLNIEIFEELEGSPFEAVLKYVWKSFKEKFTRTI